MMYLARFPRKRNIVKIESANDIPKFLNRNIGYYAEELYLFSARGVEKAPLGSCIEYRKEDGCYNVWVLDPDYVETLNQWGGEYYNRLTPMRAEKIGDEFPEFLKAGRAYVRHYSDGRWAVRGMEGHPGKGYWIKEGEHASGAPEISIVTRSAYKYYLVCTEAGQVIGRLDKIDPA